MSWKSASLRQTEESGTNQNGVGAGTRDNDIPSEGSSINLPSLRQLLAISLAFSLPVLLHLVEVA